MFPFCGLSLAFRIVTDVVRLFPKEKTVRHCKNAGIFFDSGSGAMTN
jgi:hypothetical protein